MKWKSFVWFVFLQCVLAIQGYAQYTNTRCKWVKPTDNGIVVDSLSILPGSIQVQSPHGITATYDINKNLMYFAPAPLPDSILVCYRVYPFALHKPVYNRDVSIYDSIGSYRESVRYSGLTTQQREELFSTPGINKTGVISRGISVGNNQSVFVNSNLNLQLDGKLSDDLMLTAVISDQNIPFQPEGNTQLIQQFDRVYIQLKGKRTTLTAGDIVLHEKSYFLNYYRNIQGGQVEYKYKRDSTAYSVSQVGIGVSKGKFHSMQFAPGTRDSLIEGVQGPYRLRGPNGERYIIVIANSEKIYLDGRLLTRGFDYDYVIDYNNAEITFTPNVLITRFSRVRVDFEFSDKNYSRTNVAATQTYVTPRSKVFVGYFSEKDNPRNPLLQELSFSDQQYLSTIGDNLSAAFLSGVDSVGHNENKVLYRKVNIAGVDVYEYSTNRDSAFYEVKFSQIGAGLGSYRLDRSTVNARIYKYVGAGNGDYEPIQQVITPKQKQMIQFSGEQKVGKYHRIFGDLAYSDYDVNLYSDLDKANDQGTSLRMGYGFNKVPVRLIKGYTLSGTAQYEFNHKNFTAIDRFRSADFERYWSENSSIIGNNQMASAQLVYQKNKHELFSYGLNYRDKQNDITGIQQNIIVYQKWKQFYLKGDGFFNQVRQTKGSADWQKYSLHTYYIFNKITPGFQYQTEKNKVMDSLSKIQSSMMYFEEYKGYIKSSDTSRFRYLIEHTFRKDWEVFNKELAPNTMARTTGIIGGYRFSSDHQISFNGTYRYLDASQGPTKNPNEETLLGRADWNVNALKRHVRSDLTVTTGTGRETRKQFVFQPVATGLGTHVWRDFNNDGRQEINEFVEKIYNDTLEFIKLYLPTDDYYKAFTNAINYRLEVATPRSWRNSPRALFKIASKLSSANSFTLNKRTTDESLLVRFNPFTPAVGDTTLLGFQRAIRTILFFNRASSLYGFDFAFNRTDSRQFLSQGFENRSTRDWILGSRLTIKRLYAIKGKLTKGLNVVASDFNTFRNFAIDINKVNFDFSYQPRNNLRLTLLTGYTYKINILSGGQGENTRMADSGVELKWNKLSQRTFTGTVKYINVISDLKTTPQNSPLAYELQEALLKGNNFTWSVHWQERLTNGLQISFTYEGRSSPTARTIHTGRMQLSALF
jgi:hypothetical protein